VLRPRFYTSASLQTETAIRLEKEPSRHIAKALRMRPGDALCLFDGEGREGHGAVEEIERNTVSIKLHSVADKDRESPLRISLAIALSRGDRMDTVIQKATELGVGRIQPLISERTGVRLDEERLAKKHRHWEKIAISACEQCGRNRLPQIEAPTSFTDVLAHAGTENTLRLVLDPQIGEHSLPAGCESVVLLVGPEGGFSDTEIQAAKTAGFQGLQLGPRVLRTETAPLAAIAVAQARWGDFT